MGLGDELMSLIERKGEDVDREALAELCHQQWSGWMQYLFEKSFARDDGSVVIPPDLVKRWKRQLSTPYKNLSKKEQNSDRTEADKFIALIRGSDN